MLSNLNAYPELVKIAQRKELLIPTPPPGANTIVTNREGRVDV